MQTYRFGGSEFLLRGFVPNSSTGSSDDVIEMSILGLSRNVSDNLVLFLFDHFPILLDRCLFDNFANEWCAALVVDRHG